MFVCETFSCAVIAAAHRSLWLVTEGDMEPGVLPLSVRNNVSLCLFRPGVFWQRVERRGSLRTLNGGRTDPGGRGKCVCVGGAAAAGVSMKRFERSVECKKRAGNARRRSYQRLPLTDGRCPHLKMDNVKPQPYRVVGGPCNGEHPVWYLVLSRCFEMLINTCQGERGRGPVFGGQYPSLKVGVPLFMFYICQEPL